MRLGTLFFLAPQLIAAQNLLVDLSGEWRQSPNDRPAYAATTFDDRDWRMAKLPRGGELYKGPIYWLRRRVELPRSMSPFPPLAITLGTIRDKYELYVNGQRVGATGSLESFRLAQIPRPMTFDLPAGIAAPGEPLVVALRVRGGLASHPYWRLLDEGPYLLTDQAHAPRDAGRRQLERRWIAASPQLGFGAIFLVLGLICLLGWVTDRSRRELLWFGLVCVSRTLVAVLQTSILLAQVPSFDGESAGWGTVLGNLELALLGEFIFAALDFRPRAVRMVAWLAFALAFATTALDESAVARLAVPIPAYLLVSVLLCITVGFNWWTARRRARGEDHVLRAVLVVALGMRVAVWIAVLASIGTSLQSTHLVERPGQTFLVAGPFWFAYDDLFWLIVSVALLSLLLRRWAADRREKSRLAGEMEAARIVQQLLIPAHSAAGVDAVYLPANEVGGDFWHLLDDRLVVIGDVSGKGLKAAMVVSLVTGALRNRRSDSPAALLRELNGVVHGSAGFVTCCIVRLEPDGKITVANAGHPSPYLNGREIDLAPGLPLGVVPEADYRESAFAVDGPLTLVSDGVVEAATTSGELFGFDRTRAISTQSAQAIAEAAKQWGQNDDITVVTIRSVLA